MTENRDDRSDAMLKVYISDCCFVCKDTLRIIDEIRKAIPELKIEVINLGNECQIPDSVFSVPTFHFNGKAVSLGNPSGDFIHRLKGMISDLRIGI